MKQGIRFVFFIMVSFLAVFSAYIFIKGKADAKKYAGELTLIKSCNFSGVKKIKVHKFWGKTEPDIIYIDSSTIGKILSEICKATPLQTYSTREGEIRSILLHIYTAEGIALVFLLSKDGSRPVRVEYNPEDVCLWSRETEELSFLFTK